MCFSASASFIASALLISSGIYGVSSVIQTHHYAYLPIGSIPILFGIQQGWEGMIWLSFNDNIPQVTRTYALGFLFFSHFLWLFWMTLSALTLETRPIIQKVLAGLMVMGILYGIFLYFPLLFYPDWLSVQVFKGSIRYQIQVLSTGIISPYLGIFLYICVSLIGLFLSSKKELNYLGGMLLGAFILTEVLLDYAFISVWCFLAATISFYLIYFVYSENFLPKTPER